MVIQFGGCMKLLNTLIYDPRKFFGAVVIFFWALPILLVGLVSVSAGAVVNNNDYGMSRNSNESRSSNNDGNTEMHATKKTNTVSTRSVHNNCNSDSDNNDCSCACSTTKKKVTHQAVTRETVKPQPVQPTVIYKTKTVTVPVTRVVEKPVVKYVPQKTTVVKFVPQKTTVVRQVPQTVNNSAAAAATSSAVVNVAAAQAPQVEAANTNNYQTDTSSTSTTAAANDTTASTNVVYQTTPTSYGKTLPNTGAGSILPLAGFATIVSGLTHYLYRRRIAKSY
ncbi:hypothetical protein KW794_01315 [Candidatus Saccharibacteria bacterium]|nr:hypothetical protein [Candidatus Saccharibacteria bacterium]